MFIPKLVLLHRDLTASLDDDFKTLRRTDSLTLLEFDRRKKEIQAKFVARKTNSAEGGADWKI